MSKLNWGHGVTIAVSIFILFTSSFVFFTTTVQVDLVRTDYYDAEVNFDKHKEKIENGLKDNQYFSVQKLGENIQLVYSDSNLKDKIKGELHMYYPANKTYDKRITFTELSANGYLLSSMRKGKWILKFDWKINEREYYQEKPVFLEL